MYTLWNKVRRGDEVLRQQALTQAHRIWVERHPDWGASFFDEHFLQRHLLPLCTAEELPPAVTIAEAWSAQFHLPRAKATALVAELTPLAADLLCLVATARCELRTAADSRGRKLRWLQAWWPGNRARRAGSFS